ncbi:MAG: protein phosphatase 2C domain-containing protein, partial [Gammaproteobacteria bacterium]|nr:protein phosphatase 2C domain-containing protein [Gammaproteobacteria bacterium]
MNLILDAGFSSLQGKRRFNEDRCLVITPSTGQHQDYGALLAVADGVGGIPGGAEASECAVTTLRDSYYATPETWNLQRALSDCFTAVNRAVLLGEPTGRATTLSAVVLRSRRWTLAHAGDTRIWLYRNRQLTQLTHDHNRSHVDIGSVVIRACGLDAMLNSDADSGELAQGDV